MQLTLFISSLIVLFGIYYPNQLLAQNTAQSLSKIIKTETCWVYPIDNNTPSSSGYQSSVTEYNSMGKKEKFSTFTPSGNLMYEFLFDYNNNIQEMYWISASGEKVICQTEEYNSNGAILKLVRYDLEGKQLDVCITTYNQQQKASETYYNKSVKVYSINYSYNATQNIIRETYTDFLNNEIFVGATDLNKQALPISYTQYKSSGPLEKAIEYGRDFQGRIISKKTSSDNNQLDINEVYEYDANSTKCFIYLGPNKILAEHTIYTFEYH